MTTGIPPVVYLGPTLDQAQARKLLPSARFQGPIRRGDLYRDRMLRYSVFVIIDGSFLHHEAVSPREVVDVIRDGATLIGASSMGALRAAECWPAGMVGIGAIYRLFRAGRLASDDEVAVTFDSETPGRKTAVPLVNVRHAVSRAVRAGLVDSRRAERIVESARRIHYAERSWPTILRESSSGAFDEALYAFFSKHDLKASDARRALKYASDLLARNPSLSATPRRGARPFVPSEAKRERDCDPSAGEDRANTEALVYRHYVANGRLVRYACTWTLPETDATTKGNDADASRSEQLRHQVWAALERGGDGMDATLLQHLESTGDMPAALYGCRAIRDAAQEARTRGWRVKPTHRQVAEDQIAKTHGYPSWAILEANVGKRYPRLWAWVTEHCDELALAKCAKEALSRTSWPLQDA